MKHIIVEFDENNDDELFMYAILTDAACLRHTSASEIIKNIVNITLNNITPLNKKEEN